MKKILIILATFLTICLKQECQALKFDNSQQFVENTQVYRDTVIITFKSEFVENVKIDESVYLVNKETNQQLQGQKIEDGTYAFNNVTNEGVWYVKTSYEGVFVEAEEKTK